MKTVLNQRGDPASAVVSINPDNGAIRAMTAVVPGKKEIQFNLAAQAGGSRAPPSRPSSSPRRSGRGSTRTRRDTSRRRSTGSRTRTEPWDVATYSHSYIGAVPIATATLSSDNTVCAPDARRRAGERRGWRRRWGSRPSCCPWLPSGSGRTPSRCSRWPRRTPRSAGASTRSRWRSARSSWPTDRRQEAGWGVSAQARHVRRVAYEVTRILQNNITGGTGTGAAYGDPAAEDRHDRQLGRRVVRRATRRRRPPWSGSATRTPRSP